MMPPAAGLTGASRGVEDRLLVIARLKANEGAKLIGTTVGDLVRTHQLVVVTYGRDGGTIFHPPMDVAIQAGDQITVECEPLTLKTLHALNAPAA